MERRFVAVNGRQVHCTLLGNGGPAVVLLHASPGDWSPLRALATELARTCTVYALDTPGHGGSDPLPVPDPAMSDYGDALGDTLAALGLDRAHLYGTHTGAKIALSLAVSRPDAVASLVLDGIGVSTPEERADQLARYLPPVVPRSDGGHLVAAWHQVRNMFLYWPWYNERAEARLPGAPPAAAYLHEMTAGLLEAGEHYPLAYRAAFTCDPVPLLARLTVPALILASPADPLHAHLARLPGDFQVETSASDPAELAARVRAHVQAAGPQPGPVPPPGEQRARSYVDTRLGQMLVRRAGPGGGRPLVVLPPAPASSGAVTRVLAEAGRRRPAYALDLPGTGRSGLGGPADLAELAGAVADALDALGLDGADLYGSGAGAVVATAVARARAGLVRTLALAAPPALTPGEARARTPALDPDEHGAHLLRAWHLVRDGGLRTGLPEQPDGSPDLALLHGRVLDVARSWRTYGHVFRAAAVPLGEPPAPVVAADPVWDPFTATSTGPVRGRDGTGGVPALLDALEEEPP